MDLNDATRWLQPRQQPPRDDESRATTAVSIATSTSSFRIPGIRPSAPAATRDQQPAAHLPSSPLSFVQFFAPQINNVDTSLHASEHSHNPPVHWLDKHGPSPRELIDSSQGIPRDQNVLQLHRPDHGRSHPDPAPDEWSSAHLAATFRPATFRSDDQPRPFTASSYHRSRLVTADGSAGSYVCALIENRGTGREVGIASIERETGLCIITQLADTPTYVRTIHHLAMYPPNMLLVPASGSGRGQNASFSSAPRSSKRGKTSNDGGSDTDAESYANRSKRDSISLLVRTIEQLYDIEARPFPRRHWNYYEGARHLDRLLVDDVDTVKKEDGRMPSAPAEHHGLPSQPSQRPTSSRPQTGRFSLDLNDKASTRAAILVAAADKFYLLSAFAGLIEFYTETFNRVFTPRTLRIRHVFPEDTILINSNTAHDLELVRNLIDPKSKDSLLGLLDHCVSPMGQRLLRTNILQPLSDPDAIALRQEAVAECINSEERFHAVSESMHPIRYGAIDLDKLIYTLACPQKKGADARIETERKLSSILSLRTLLRSLGPLRDALRNASSALLQSISTFLESDDIDEIRSAIQDTIDEEVALSKGWLGSRNARMYAVRADRSPLLDVARQTYRENFADIEELRQRLESESNLSLSLRMISTGYLLRTELDISEMKNLPEYFTNVTRAKSGKSVTMTTLSLKKLNARLVNSMNEVCKMSETIIDELIQHITGQIASLNKVSEALALLDMIVSLAIVSRANDYVRPTFGDRLDIRNARHPILDRVDIVSAGVSSVATRRRRAFVPNDIYLAPGERVCIVTGPNMSGKSTLLRQIALITVLAAIGCFVPASRATLPIPDALLSLLTHEDDPTQNLSTFAAEMRTSAFILSVASPNSLVILDEMGRGTSPDEGCAVATAIVEDLITEKGCTVFYATHFGELIEGLEGKEGVVCQHLNVSMVQRREDVDLVFHHKLLLGSGLDTHYSLQVAKMMGCFGARFLQRAEAVAVAEQATAVDRSASLDSSTRERRKVVRNVVRDLRRLDKEFYVEGLLKDRDKASVDASPPMVAEKLALLQLHASSQLERTFVN